MGEKMRQKLENQGDILFSLLNTTYAFLGERGGEYLLKDWCEYVAEHGLWNGVVDAVKAGGTQGMKAFWDDFLRAEGMPETSCKTEVRGDEFIMTITHCHSQDTVKRIGAKLYGEACMHCRHICEKMAEMVGYDLDFTYDPEKGCCTRRWTKRREEQA